MAGAADHIKTAKVFYAFSELDIRPKDDELKEVRNLFNNVPTIESFNDMKNVVQNKADWLRVEDMHKKLELTYRIA